MTRLTSRAEQIADDLARQHGFSTEAVRHMIRAVDAGWGSMASFDHPEFGGPGQWMQGGMIMLGEPFNHGLRAKVDALCNEIAGVYEAETRLIDRPSSQASQSAWPSALGTPATTGSQGDMHYAYFPTTRRLALIRSGRLQIFDTGDHRITGVAQQQNNRSSDVSFVSQHGTVDLDALTPIEAPIPDRPAQPTTTAPATATNEASTDVIQAIERLGELRDRGLLTDDEFSAKKTELLSRL
ncbi:SHOCT domain-containing protein [Salinisphaera sp. SPP-AMP-43]|uniref:SHOCT domain-containing protein n=1 Tax=Salinisphaera sp. SPP-AMP-43 TaxID=3121288 RepID=UPI003C6E0DE5